MTANCELCGRGTAQKALTPTWWPYDVVCDRAHCRAAARDAVEAILDARDEYDSLAAEIGKRADPRVQAMPLGWRDDTMAKIDVVENEQWWANDIVKRV